mgnify:CR=1 FL=1
MRSRQARKIVRMVKYTPIDRMSSAWFDRALQWCATYRQPHIKKALRYYWNGVADGRLSHSITKKNFQETNSYEKKNCTKNRQLQGNASTPYQQGHVPLPSHPRTLEPVNKRQELQHLLCHGQLGTCPHLLTLLSRRARRTRIRLRCVAR